MKKSVSISKIARKCDWCGVEHYSYAVRYQDIDKDVTVDAFGYPTPTKLGRACSPQHALKLLEKYLIECGEMGEIEGVNDLKRMAGPTT